MSKILQRLFMVKLTQTKMVSDRGYNVDETVYTWTVDDFIDYIKENMDDAEHRNEISPIHSVLTQVYVNTEGKKILVYYGTRGDVMSIPITVVDSFIKKAFENKVSEAILIVDAHLSSDSSKALTKMSSSKCRCQIFEESELTYSSIASNDVPLQVKLTKEEAYIKMKQLKAGSNRLLILNMADPVVKYYGWQPGDMIKVFRDDSALNILSPKYYNYRVVVNK